jgi:hypothetical protein
MGDYSGSADVGVPAGQLFGYLSDISNLHTERAGSGDIGRGIASALAAIKQLAEAGPAPGPAS